MGFVELLSAPWFWLALGFMLLLLELMTVAVKLERRS